MIGKIKWYDKDKGYGFITAESGQDIYVHHTGFKVKPVEVQKGAAVEFTETDGPRGPKAVAVTITG